MVTRLAPLVSRCHGRREEGGSNARRGLTGVQRYHPSMHSWLSNGKVPILSSFPVCLLFLRTHLRFAPIDGGSIIKTVLAVHLKTCVYVREKVFTKFRRSNRWIYAEPAADQGMALFDVCRQPYIIHKKIRRVHRDNCSGARLRVTTLTSVWGQSC